MKKLSLQVKITLLCAMILTAACLLLTVTSMIFSSRSLTGVAQQATTVITDFAVTFEDYAAAVSAARAVDVKEKTDAAELEKAPESTWLDDQVVFTSNLESFLSGEVPVELQQDMIQITTAVNDRLQVQVLALMVAIIILGILGIYLTVSRLTRPLRDLSTSIGTLDEEKLSTRLEENGIREVAELSRAFNQMITRLDDAFERQKRFTADAAHELKTPLASIQVNLDSLGQDEEYTAEEAAEVLEVTQRNIRRLNQLAENLLQLNSAQMIEQRQRCSVHDCLCTILEELKPRIKQKQLTIQLAEVYPCLDSEPTLLLRCLYNCVENAVKYSPENSTIRIELEKTEQEVRIGIINPSEPISESQCAQLFQPFYRLDASRSRKLGGSGLGLAITQEIVQRLGGSVRALWQDGEFKMEIRLQVMPDS
ncbi:sensor histidine kinase [Holdemania massiliensis]|uniref:histidine kinase n=1 Tax=Holdemania massiliensis TaxID=1468449 RepID=A0A6N7S4N9_9FIRM|nr:ATP-binding protein [Holdemania massiliensis]MSA69937.1 HAMP domain-containing protein [Holdemania massiliensis]MSA88595.1 HAMP domain-containing protein [Holdemania massiliensis]MSB77216.1 HAMP domain-containing protein [Holdemania massiliensis]MSC32142.1 HAMP domain-containing protein [Holdemania massiliensis]MSC38483.1 HAMP domain-containing protein [Holdemania massiliensis]